MGQMDNASVHSDYSNTSQSLAALQVPPANWDSNSETPDKYNVDKYNLEQGTQDGSMAINSLGLTYRQIGDGAYPSFFKRDAVDRLRENWTARSSDVFLVFPNTSPTKMNFLAYSVALVEQCDVADVDLGFPRWIDAAVSRRGWGYVDAIDASPSRRLLLTHSPPSRFPCSNPGLNPNDDITNTPRIAVFVADPRYMLMKEFEELTSKNSCMKFTPGTFDLQEFLAALTDNENATGLMFDGIRTSMAWAEAEAKNPDRIRLFFVEDFVLQPEVAMRGLANFLEVSSLSYATEKAVQQASAWGVSSKLDWCSSGSVVPSISQETHKFEHYVTEFERQLALAPKWLMADWENLLDRWLQSPSPRIQAYALTAMHHERWDPPSWWVSHNARVCRPCLFFPRGACKEDDCGFCHGVGHAKPKRPPRSKRNQRRRRYDRTPSPSGLSD